MALPPPAVSLPPTMQAQQPPNFGSTSLGISYGQQNGNQNVATNDTGTAQSRAYFNPQQQAAQGDYFNRVGGYLAGTQQIPAYFTAPPEVFKAANDAFNKYVKPGIYSQYGTGSPQSGAQQAFMNEQLAAELYQGGQQNWLATLGMLGNPAFNPQGQNTQNAAQGQENTQMQQSKWDVGLNQTAFGQSLLSLLLGKLGGT